MLKFLDILSSFFKILPRSVNIFMYNFFKPYSGKIILGLRMILCRSIIQKLGQKVIIGSNVTFKNAHRIIIGDHVSIHENCYLDGCGGIEIGNAVSIAHNSTIMSSSHLWDNKSIPIRENRIKKEKTTICDNVWMGCGVRVLCGVTINSNVIVGANSVVNKSLPSNYIYAGVPAKLISGL